MATIVLAYNANKRTTAASIAVLLACAALARPLHAQTYKCGADAASTIATDRPQITNSSVVVPCGSLQLENGFQETTNNGVHIYDLPETSLRLGIAHKTEVRVGVPDYFVNAPNGFGDLLIGLKQQLGPLHGFDVSLIPSLSLPTGANALSSHGYDPSLQVPWSRSLSSTWTAAGQLALLDPTESSRHNATGQASLYFDRQITAPWDAYCEYSGSFPQRGGPQHIIDAGTAYKLSPHQQLDLHVNFGLSAATSPFAIGFGYSIRFQAFHSR
jgi:hypothetical protein